MHFLLLAGSFHKNSYSQALLAVVADYLVDHQASIAAINTLPFYCEDLSGDKRPSSVTGFLELVQQADAIIICTPEYNHSIPAVLKNAIDWASRPAFASPLKGKPVSFITQANSQVGGARAQAHLKLVLDSTLSRIHSCHEMMVAQVEQKFDARRMLIDEKVRHRLHRHIDDFISFIG